MTKAEGETQIPSSTWHNVPVGHSAVEAHPPRQKPTPDTMLEASRLKPYALQRFAPVHPVGDDVLFVKPHFWTQ